MLHLLCWSMKWPLHQALTYEYLYLSMTTLSYNITHPTLSLFLQLKETRLDTYPPFPNPSMTPLSSPHPPWLITSCHIRRGWGSRGRGADPAPRRPLQEQKVSRSAASLQAWYFLFTSPAILQDQDVPHVT